MRTLGTGMMAGMSFFGSLEICARVDDYLTWGAPLTGPYSAELLRVQDEDGWHNRAGAAFEKWRVNSDGFRGADVAVGGSPDVTRIAVLGASETFGLYESFGMEYPAQLDSILSDARPGRFEVINAGVAGMSLGVMDDYFVRRVARFSPDIVLIYPTPVFYLSIDPPGGEPVIAPTIDPGSQSPTLVQLRIPAMAFRIAKRVLPENLQTMAKLFLIERRTDAHAPDWVWQEPPPERAVLFEQHLRELVRVVTSQGARVLLATHANRFEGVLPRANDNHMVSWRRFYPRATGACILAWEEQANDIVRRVAAEEGATVLEFADAIGDSMSEFADYQHFTDTGARRVAAYAAAAVLDGVFQTTPLVAQPSTADEGMPAARLYVSRDVTTDRDEGLSSSNR